MLFGTLQFARIESLFESHCSPLVHNNANDETKGEVDPTNDTRAQRGMVGDTYNRRMTDIRSAEN